MQGQSTIIMDIPTDSIEIPNSESTDTPVETPSEETPETEGGAETPADPETPEETLYELPDGRKVDAATLQKEWSENFAPEFTRRSQELAELKKGPLPTEDKPVNPYDDPDYVPGTYAEIIEAAKLAAIAEIKGEAEATKAAQTAAENAVIEQLESVKKLDPNVDENKLFLHANKYGFRDLSTAYQNMKDMGQITKTVQKQTAENIQKRKDPVSIQPGGNVGTSPDPSSFSSAVDFMRSLKT